MEAGAEILRGHWSGQLTLLSDSSKANRDAHPHPREVLRASGGVRGHDLLYVQTHLLRFLGLCYGLHVGHHLSGSL